eukprot:212227_1
MESHWKQILKVGDKIDGRFHDQGWEIMEIISIELDANSDATALRLTNSDTTALRCISIHDDTLKLAPLYTYTFKMDRLSSNNLSPHAIYNLQYSSRQSAIITTTQDNIVAFDCKQNCNWHTLYKFPKATKELLSNNNLLTTYSALDDTQNILYSFNVHLNRLSIFNLNSHELQINKIASATVPTSEYSYWCKVYFISEYFYHSQFHFIGNKEHHIYKDGKIIKLCDNPLTFDMKIYYLQCMKRLFAFAGWCANEQNNKIFYLDSTCLEWKQFSVLPIDVSIYEAEMAIGFEHILFVMQRNWESTEQDIWCLDLLTCRWFECQKKYPMGLKLWETNHCYDQNITTNDNYLHILGEGEHVKISLFDIIPESLYCEYKNRYNLLVFGWIRRFETNNGQFVMIDDFPSCLKRLMLLYISHFI